VLEEKIILIAVKRGHVVPVPSAEVIHADDEVAIRKKPIRQVKTEKAGTSSDQRDSAGGSGSAHGRLGGRCEGECGR
jgi:hypothetical protein